MGFGGQFTTIKGLSDRRRLPRMDKIRLGFKLKKGDVEYPAELPFFLLPDEVARVYGFKSPEEAVSLAEEMGVARGDVLKFIRQNAWRLAREIEIMLPINDVGAVFPQAYKWYGSQRGVKCIGNGEVAKRYDEKSGGMIDVECPCENLKSDENPRGECVQRAHLLCLVPKVSMGGVYQIDVGSYHSIVDVNSGIDYVSALIGRFALVPLVLRRVPRETHHEGQKRRHFTLQLICDIDVNTLNQLRADTQRVITHQQFLLPPPDDTNPALDTEGEVVMEVEAGDEGETVDAGPAEPVEPEVVTEPEKKKPSPQKGKETSEFSMLKKMIEESEDLSTLKQAWERVMRAGDKLNKRQISQLNKLKNKQKEEIKSRVTVDLDQVRLSFEGARSIEELDGMWAEVEQYLDGEDKVAMRIERDRRATELRKMAGGEDEPTPFPEE